MVVGGGGGRGGGIMAVRSPVKAPKVYFKSNGEFILLQLLRNWYAGKISSLDSYV
jgi:hypothetical protein